ncbi:MAG TPA: hypothetical protein VFE47_31015 [Tepidisphaeraceae bacterium]|nr:hypothetical protein [Tepidisphaeraceae bacterium]
MTFGDLSRTIGVMDSATFDSGILRRMLGPDEAPLPPEVASFFLKISLDANDSDRIARLSEKANEGELTSEEADQLSYYIMLADFIAIMHSKARVSLKDKNPAA